MLKSFDEFLNEAASPTLRKSLDKLDVFDDEEEIIQAIIDSGFEQKKPNWKVSCDYAFLNPTTEKEYRSYTTGTVRAIWEPSKYSNKTVWVTRVTRDILPDTKDRLLLILRLALKKSLGNLYDKFIHSNQNIKEFLHSHRGMLGVRKFGL
jgi:hypothetical protein